MDKFNIIYLFIAILVFALVFSIVLSVHNKTVYCKNLGYDKHVIDNGVVEMEKGYILCVKGYYDDYHIKKYNYFGVNYSG